MFRLAVITTPENLPREEEALRLLGDTDGVYSLHLRKPGQSVEQLRQLLLRLPQNTLQKIRLHSHFELCSEFSLQGVHLNRLCPTPPQDATSVSASCHSIEEVRQKKTDRRFVFLSPIFNSISKQNYQSAFTEEELRQAARNGIIDQNVFALGGVEAQNIALLKEMGFGGAGMIGGIWRDYAVNADLKAFGQRLQKILKECI